jgi:two-component system, cell cycle response regulator
VVQGMQAGADDYLTKPFQLDQLATRLIAADRITVLHRQLASQQTELERLNQMLFEDSRHDRLTGLGNRRRLDEDLERLADLSRRYDHALAVVLFDVDRFKQYNDSAGHAAGDEVLRCVAAMLAEQCRGGDSAYRYGGEELLIAFPEQDLHTATIAAERMRTAIEGLAIPHPGVEPESVVTVSGGVACLGPDESVGSLLGRADAALYRAKRDGRNRIVGAPVGVT